MLDGSMGIELIEFGFCQRAFGVGMAFITFSLPVFFSMSIVSSGPVPMRLLCFYA